MRTIDHWIAIFIIALCCHASFGQSEVFNGLTVKDGLSQGLVYDMLQSQDGYIWIATKDGLNRYDGYNFTVFKNRSDNPFSIGKDENKVLFEDSRGYIWIGTNGPFGINIFDPGTERFYRVSTEHFYTEKDKKTLWPIISIGEDADGYIWIGTQYGRVIQLQLEDDFLSHFDEEGTPVNFSLDNWKSYEMYLPEVVAIDNRGRKADFVNSFFLASDNEFYLGTITRIMKWQPKQEQWLTLGEYGHKYEDYDGFKTVTEDNDGQVWFANESRFSLVRIDDLTAKEFVIGTEDEVDLCRVARDEFGNFYISSSEGVYSIAAENIKNESLNKEVIKLDDFNGQRPIIVDKTNNVWVRHPAMGISKFSPFQKKFDSYLNGESIYRVFPNSTGTEILIGKTDFGIWKNKSHMILLEWEVPHYHSLYFQSDKNLVWTVQREEGNNTDAILVKENYLTGQRVERSFPEEVLYQHPFIEDGDKLWVGLNKGGLGLINQNDLSVEPYLFPDEHQLLRDETETIFIYKDSRGDYYQCTNDGLLFIDIDENGLPQDYRLFVHEVNDAASLSGNHILCAEDDPLYPDSILWVGTKGSGINKMIKSTGECVRYGISDGLPDDVIYGILADQDSNLWMSSNRGICRLSLTSGEFLSFKEADGLQSTEFNTGSFARLPEEKFAFGGVDGLNIFDPKDIRLNEFQPSVIISALKVNNVPLSHTATEKGEEKNEEAVEISQPLSELKNLELNYDQNLLSIEYAAMDFTNPEKNKYKYILEGQDNEWNEVGNIRLAIYSNLNPGYYVFKVAGTNSEGVWSEHVRELAIIIRPPWWKSNVALVVYFLTVLTLLYTLYTFLLNRAKLKNQLAYETKEAERLVELDRMKTNFFSNIAHELRTPLTLIIEPLRMVLKEPLNIDVRNKLKLIKGNSERLLQLVNQLLDFSKLTENRMKLDRRRLDIMDIIRPIYQSFLMLADQKGIALKMNYDSNLGTFWIDKDKVEKIVFNLLSNAIKFTDEGTVNLSIEKVAESEEDNLKIKVSDTGKGILQQNLDQIFDRFYQIESNTTRSGEGTGIGLSLTKELVHLMDGEITVNSTVGKGSLFEVTIPMVHESVEKVQMNGQYQGRIEEWSQTEYPLSMNGEKQTIVHQPNISKSNSVPTLLLVDDNIEIREFIDSLLNRHFEIVQASNGEEGVRKAIKIVPDIIVSDVMMPKKDGIQLTEELKSNENTSHIPIVLLTAKSDMGSKLDGLREGADAYVTKPFNSEELVIRTQKLIENRERIKKSLQNVSSFLNNTAAVELADIDQSFLKKVDLFINAHMGNPELSVEDLAANIFMSRSQLFRKMKGLVGISPSDYIREYRLARAKQMLENSEGSISEIAERVGFNNVKYFSTRFKSSFGISPSQLVKQSV